MKDNVFPRALKDTLPVMAGYLVLGMGFGMVMDHAGFSFWCSVTMSVFIYAGSMQYAGVGLMTGGASLVTVALTTLAVNARHLFYGISMVEKYKGTGWRKPYLIFALTDETYSLVCTDEKSPKYMLTVSLLDHLYWVAGTALGALMGKTLPINTTGVDFALTALFLTVFTDQWLKQQDHFPALTGVVLSVLCLLLFGPEKFLIPAMGLILAALLIKGKAGKKKHE